MTESSQNFPQRLVLHCRAAGGELSALDLLVQQTAFSRGRMKQVMSQGAVWCGRGRQVQRLRRAGKIVQPGEVLHLYYDHAVMQQQPALPTLISDETDYSVWYKPAGLFSQGSRWGDHCSLPRCAEQQLQRTAFIVHRLDRAASGLMIIAHSKSMASALSGLFARRELTKRYLAIVHGQFDDRGGSRVLNDDIDGRQAVSHARLLACDEVKNMSLVEVSIESGRKHQIRRHLAGVNHAIVGDRLYGQDNGENDLQLTACKLSFLCPRTHEQKNYVLEDAYLPKLDSIGI